MEKILLVDDESDILEFVSYNLSKEGFQVITCNNGKEAIQIAQKENPDLIILDVMMPEMDGPTTFQSVKKQFPEFKQPVIFMTAKVMSHEVDEYLVLGAAGVICKPFNPKDLADDVRRICADWASRQCGDDSVAKSVDLLLSSGD